MAPLFLSLLLFYSWLYSSDSYPCGVCQCFTLPGYAVMDCSYLHLRKIDLNIDQTMKYHSVLLDGNELNCLEVKSIMNRTSPTLLNLKKNPTLDCDCIHSIRTVKFIISDCERLISPTPSTSSLFPSESSSPSSNTKSTNTVATLLVTSTSSFTLTTVFAEAFASQHSSKYTLGWILGSSLLVPLTFIAIWVLYKLKHLRRRVPQDFELQTLQEILEQEDDDEVVVFTNV